LESPDFWTKVSTSDFRSSMLELFSTT
jgi:hypothetical protein